MNSDNDQLTYRIVSGRDPATGKTLLRPVITGRKTVTTNDIINYAIETNYVRGGASDLRGTFYGLIDVIRRFVDSGYSIYLDNWIRIYGELTGSVGEERKLTSANSYKINIKPLGATKRKVSDFKWKLQN